MITYNEILSVYWTFNSCCTFSPCNKSYPKNGKSCRTIHISFQEVNESYVFKQKLFNCLAKTFLLTAELQSGYWISRLHSNKYILPKVVA